MNWRKDLKSTTKGSPKDANKSIRRRNAVLRRLMAMRSGQKNKRAANHAVYIP